MIKSFYNYMVGHSRALFRHSRNFLRHSRESGNLHSWIPAFAGMTLVLRMTSSLKKFFYNATIFFFLNFLFIKTANAVCPLCTIAVAGGVGLAEWLGVDDTISGIWIGGIVVSLIIWIIAWLDKKNIHFKGRKILVTLLCYLLIIGPLYPMKVMGNPLNTLWGMDKLLLGIILGSIFFFFGSIWYFYLKKRHGGHAYFPFQKVVMPVAPLIILSIIFYFIT